MPYTIHLSDGRTFQAELQVWDDLNPETRGPWYSLYWSEPGSSAGTRAHDNYLSFRTIKAARAYGEKHFSETAVRIYR